MLATYAHFDKGINNFPIDKTLPHVQLLQHPGFGKLFQQNLLKNVVDNFDLFNRSISHEISKVLTAQCSVLTLILTLSSLTIMLFAQNMHKNSNA